MTLAKSLHMARDKTTLIARHQSASAGPVGSFDFEKFVGRGRPPSAAMLRNVIVSLVLVFEGGCTRARDGKSSIPPGKVGGRGG